MGKLVRVFVLAVSLLAMPALAGAQTLQVSSDDILNAPGDLLSKVQSLPPQQLGAIVGGGVVAGVLADALLDGGIITVVGVILGATVGNYWYERHYWPF